MLFYALCGEKCVRVSAELTESSIPTISKYVVPAVEQLDDLEKMTEEERENYEDAMLYKNNHLFMWYVPTLAIPTIWHALDITLSFAGVRCD